MLEIVMRKHVLPKTEKRNSKTKLFDRQLNFLSQEVTLLFLGSELLGKEYDLAKAHEICMSHSLSGILPSKIHFYCSKNFLNYKKQNSCSKNDHKGRIEEDNEKFHLGVAAAGSFLLKEKPKSLGLKMLVNFAKLSYS